jgi:hypothetical protein
MNAVESDFCFVEVVMVIFFGENLMFEKVSLILCLKLEGIFEGFFLLGFSLDLCNCP